MNTSISAIRFLGMTIATAALRYAAFSGGAHALFGGVSTPVRKKQIRREVLVSLRSVLVNALILLIGFKLYEKGYTRIYPDFFRYGPIYPALAFGSIILLHDAYFFWTHRLMHVRILFKAIHREHHLSVQPTAFTALSFSPLEAVFQTLFVVLVILVVPMDPIVATAALIFIHAFDVYGHLSNLNFPNERSPGLLRRWTHGPSTHSIHHGKFRGNYGLYFTFWDRLAGTYVAPKVRHAE